MKIKNLALSLSLLACLSLSVSETRAQTLIHYSLHDTDSNSVAGGIIPNTGTLGSGTNGGAGITLSTDVPAKGVPPGAGNRSINGGGAGGILAPGLQQLNRTNIGNAGGFTYEAWFKWDGTGSINAIIDYAGTEKLIRRTNDTGPAMEANNSAFYAVGAAPSNQWHYAAMVFTATNAVSGSDSISGTFTFYLDTNASAVTVSNITLTSFGDSLNRTIGVAMHPSGFASDYFHGLVYEPRVTLGALPGYSLLYQPSAVVTSTADSGAGSLRSVLAGAPNGAAVTFSPALSGQTILLTNGEIVLSNNVTIAGSSLTSGIQINGNGQSRIFNVNSGVTVALNSLILTNGADNNDAGYGGGAILNFGALTANNCTFAGNQAKNGGDGGGAIDCFDTVALNNCTFTGNVADGSSFGGGGALSSVDGATVTVNNCTFAGNQANSSLAGGAILNYATLFLTNSIVCSNLPNNIGGHGYSGSSNLTDANALLAPLGNYGGPTPTMPPLAGSAAIDAGSDSIANSLVTDQRGQPRRSGAHVDIGAVEVNTNTIVTTVADTGAGSLRNSLTVAAANDLISFAPSLAGSTILLTSGNITLNQNVSIIGSALTNGGVTLNGNHNNRMVTVNNGVTASLDAITFINGNASDYGGAIQNLGALTVANSAFAGNSAVTAGGAIRNTGTLTVNECTFFGNTSANGAAIATAGSARINQSTLLQNVATVGGGGIYVNGPVALVNSIVAGNTASDGADIYINQVLTYGGSNLVQSVGGSTSVIGPVPINAAPLLAAFGNYGGPTPTMPPLAGSPAIDSGSDAAVAFAADQRGQTRVLGAHMDLGAVEVNPATIVTTAADNVSGSLRNVIAGSLRNDLISFAPNLSGSTITLGGAIGLSANVTVDASALPGGIIVNGNDADRVFIVNGGVTAALKALTITGGATGDTSSGGGAIFNGGSLALTGCTLYSNFTYSGSFNDPNGGPGGAITSHGTLALTQCTVSGNSAGGGSAIYNSGTLTLVQCTVSSNTSATGAGGAIFNGTGGALILSNSIVAANGGSSTVDVWNLRSSSTQVGTNLIQSLYNDFMGSNFGTAAISAAPKLAPFGNYGGPTPTMPPLPGSPAIDSAAITTLATDQRGYPRAVGLRPDIGAVEGVYNAAGPGIITNLTRLGDRSIRFTFTNLTDASFPVLAATNVTLPMSNWTRVGFAVESPIGSGQFPFTDVQAPNYPVRYYRVKAP